MGFLDDRKVGDDMRNEWMASFKSIGVECTPERVLAPIGSRNGPRSNGSDAKDTRNKFKASYWIFHKVHTPEKEIASIHSKRGLSRKVYMLLAEQLGYWDLEDLFKEVQQVAKETIAQIHIYGNSGNAHTQVTGALRGSKPTGVGHKDQMMNFAEVQSSETHSTRGDVRMQATNIPAECGAKDVERTERVMSGDGQSLPAISPGGAIRGNRISGFMEIAAGTSSDESDEEH